MSPMPKTNPARRKTLPVRTGSLGMNDTERMDWLERLLKSNGGTWPLVSIQTLPDYAQIGAVNRFHGNEAGLVIAPTLREAVDQCLLRNLADMVDRAALRQAKTRKGNK